MNDSVKLVKLNMHNSDVLSSLMLVLVVFVIMLF